MTAVASTVHAVGVGTVIVPTPTTVASTISCSRALGRDGDPALVFLQYGKVGLSSGPRFGPPGHGFVRLNFATAPERLTDAIHRMTTALKQGEGINGSADAGGASR